MSNEKIIEYRGPEKHYSPPLGYVAAPSNRKSASVRQEGYHDLDLLKSMLEELVSDTSDVYYQAERILSEFSLTVDQNNAEFVEAHDLVYPDDKSPGHVTFDEYKYLLVNGGSSAAQYIKAQYEAQLRGPMGTNALDISHLAILINVEAKRVQSFIESYIGELDETAEFRTVELFQDWTTDAKEIVQRLAAALKGEVAAKIPGSELDRLDRETSAGYQAVFQTGINQLNTYIRDIMAQLEKNWNTPSDSFYNKYLGPALRFQIKIANSIADPVQMQKMQETPTLAKEVENRVAGLTSNFAVALSDQLKRNKLFYDYATKLLLNVEQRDAYVKYGKQLSQIGVKLSNPFVDSSTVTQATSVLNTTHPLDTDNLYSTTSTLKASHNELIDIESDVAHPQYLLKDGDVITGDISVVSGAKIDGVDISEHTHDGVNSKKIHGSNIEWGSITSDAINTSTSNSPIPSELEIINASADLTSPGVREITARIAFEVDTTNVAGYEFEITKLA